MKNMKIFKIILLAILIGGLITTTVSANPDWIIYDDGAAADRIAQSTGGDQYLVFFTSPFYPCKVITAQVYISSFDSEAAPGSYYGFKLHVYDSSLNDLCTPIDIPPTPPTPAGFITIDLSSYDITVYGDFYIGVEYLPPTDVVHGPSLGEDTDWGASGRSYYISNSGGGLQLQTTYAYMIRAEVAPATGTFGYESMGGSDSSIENSILGSVFSSTGSGTAQSITAYIDTSSLSTPGAMVKAAIYTSGESFIAGTDEVSVSSTGWVQFDFPSPPTVFAGTDYILVAWSNSNVELSYHSGATDQGISKNLNYGDWPSDLGVDQTSNSEYSIYCTYEIENQPPVADAGGPYYGTVEAPINFDASGSTDPDDDIVSYEWDFDYDGVTFSVDATGLNPSNTWGSIGEYTVALRVTDAWSESDIDTSIVNVFTNFVSESFDSIGDSYVRQYTDDKNSNYGSLDTLKVLRESGWNTYTFIMFDLSSISDGVDISSASLHLYKTSGTPIPSAYETTDDWTELGITWSNRPSTGFLITDGSSEGSDWYVWPITDYVATEASGDNTLSVLLQGPGLNDATETDYSSREAASNNPWLEINYYFNQESSATSTSTYLDYNDGSFALGNHIIDQVEVTATSGTPTGTVDFFYKAPGGSWTQYGDSKTLDGNGWTQSDQFTPTSLGLWYFKAVYSGDATFASSESGEEEEPLQVLPAPTINTELSHTTISLGDTVTDTVTVTGTPTLPEYVGAGIADDDTDGSLSPHYPDNLEEDDLLLLQITVRTPGTSITLSGDWTKYLGPIGGGNVAQWIYYKFSDGTELATDTESITTSNTDAQTAQIFAFRNVDTTSPFESGGTLTGLGTIVVPSVTTTGDNRLAVAFVCIDDNIDLGNFYDETGGDWTEASEHQYNLDGSDLTIQLQTATMESVGTISGGKGTLSGTVHYAIVDFALKPRTITPTGTVEFRRIWEGHNSPIPPQKTLVDGLATTDPFTPDQPGDWYFYVWYWGDDNYGAVKSNHMDEHLIVTSGGGDTTKPESEVSSTGFSTYTNADGINVYYSTSDDDSGVDYVNLWVKIPGAGSYTDAGTWTSGATYTFGADGLYEFYTIATDVAGNVEDAPTTPPDQSITVDKVKPTSTATDVLPDIETVSTFNIHYTASDDRSGVQYVELYYRTYDGSTWSSWTKYAGTYTTSPISFTAPGDGHYQFDTIATDNAGNVGNEPSMPYGETVVDTTPPTGTISIESGAAYTANTLVSLDLTADSDVAWMKFSTDGAIYGSKRTYSTSSSWIIDVGDGIQRVYVMFQDNAGWWSTTDIYDDILLDQTKPTSDVYDLPTYETTLTFDVKYHSDDGTGSGVQYVELYYNKDSSGWTKYAGTFSSSPISFTATSDGVFEFYTRATDNVGNIENAPGSADDSTIVDTTGPTGSVVINDDDTYTTSTSVTLTLSASDANGVADIQFSNNGISWSGWESYGTSKSWMLTAGDGTKTVYVEYRDNAGNVISSPATDTIILDTTAPSTTLTIGTPKSGTNPTYVSPSTEFTLSATDSLSGVNHREYQFVAHGDGPDSWTTYGSAFTAPGVGIYDLCYRSIDNAGNIEAYKTEYVVVGGTSLTYTGDTDGQYSDEATLSAHLVDLATNLLIEGKTISFSINTSPVLTASSDTNSFGDASDTVILLRPADDYTVTANIAADSTYMGNSVDEDFTITLEDAIIDYTGHVWVYTAGPEIDHASAQLSALVTEAADGHLGDLTKLSVDFTLTPTQGATIHVYNVPVSADGIAYADVDVDVDTYDLDVCIVSNNYYKTDCDGNSLTVTAGSEKQTVTGGGWIEDELSINNKGNFGFTVKYNKKGDAKGSFVYVYRDEDYVYRVKSNSWRGGGLSFTGKDSNQAFFSGRCTIQIIDRETGLTVDSYGNSRFQVDITDGDLVPDGTDSIAFLFLQTDGSIYRQIGTFESQIELGNINIVIHR